MPFGGIPGFKLQSTQGPGKYGGAPKRKSQGNKFTSEERFVFNVSGPSPTTYFGMGRHEINPNASTRFNKQRRVLPSEYMVVGNNEMGGGDHQNDGKNLKPKIKGYKFSEEEGEQTGGGGVIRVLRISESNPKKTLYPGPAHYQI